MSKMLDVLNPFNGKLVETIPMAEEAEVKAVLEKAKAAKAVWANMPLYERSRVLYRFAELMDENTEELAQLLTTEMGKPIKQTRMEISGAVYITRGFVERANHLYGETICTDNQPGFENDVIFTRREPLGIITCIVPFNYPIELFVHKVAPALIMGNVVIGKAPSNNPLAMLKLSAMFEKAGGPAGVCQSLVCDREVARQYLIEGPDIQAVSFTGSTDAGVKMAVGGAPTLKHVFLELGGNDPTIILEDADLDAMVVEIAGSRVFNAGQSCCGCKRLIIHRSVAEAFTEKLVAQLKKVKIGDPLAESTDLGTVISKTAADRVMKQLEHAVKQGAKLIYGGERAGDAVVTPAVLTGVTKDMDVAIDMEIFGPAFPIIPFDTEEEALAIANQTRYGLSSGIMTRDTYRAMRLAAKIEAGAVVINGQSLYRHMDQAFGGYKMTGLGREGISSTLEEHSQLKSIVLKAVYGEGSKAYQA